ncbi:MAG: glutamate-cysteine ligase family protein [Candidatus Nanohaloarchaea archaeon]
MACIRKGIELEYFTVNRSGELTSAEPITGELEFAAPEFATCIAEIKSEPHETVDGLRGDIKQKTRRVIEHARKHGLKIVPLGTPLKHDGIELLDTERLEMMKKFNPEDIQIERELARAGTHIHFEKENVKDQLNVLTALDPAFALLNASPYHQGRNNASSMRNWVYRYSWDPKFPESVSLWEYTDSVDEWKQRINDAFEKFREGALEAGIPEEKFLEHYHPDRSIWTPIRLRDQFPTVEYRSPDATLPSETLKLVEDVQRILLESQRKEVVPGGENDREKLVLPEFERVKELSRNASKKGLKSPGVRNYLDEMGIQYSRYSPLSGRMQNGSRIDLRQAKKLRLEASRMLEEDVEEL